MSTLVLHAGVAEVDITPPLGIEMAGYGRYLKRVATQVLDPLYARALWLELGEERLLILTVDLIAIDIATRNRAAQEICRNCDIAAEHILIAASHTHSGPAVQLMIGWGERDPGYLATLPGLLATVASQARASSAPAKVGACRKRIQGVGSNREQPSIGPIDTAAQLLRVDHLDGTPLAVAFNFGMHGVSRYAFTSRISADWPGLVAAYLKLTTPATVAMFLQGCLGNINPTLGLPWWSLDQRDVVTQQQVADMRAGDVALRLAEQILPPLKAIETRPEAELRALWSWVDLPCMAPKASELQRTIDENLALAERMTLAILRPLQERLGDKAHGMSLHQPVPAETDPEGAWQCARFQVDAARYQLELLERGETVVRAPVQILKIGDAVLVGWPGEVYVELGLEVRQRSPFPLTFVIGLANDTVGYIPTPAAYESQGKANQFGKYPVSVTPWLYGKLPFRPNVGRLLVDETLRLLNRM